MSAFTHGRRLKAMAVVPLALAGALSLAAAPASAAECPNAKYRTGPSLFLPECRAYEMVTPPGKTNILKLRNATANMAKVAPDGDGILYLTATGPLTREASAGMPTWETARRADDGWKAESVTPPIVGPFGETANSYARMVVPSAGLDKIFFTSSAIFDPEQTWGLNPVFNGGTFLGNATSTTWVSEPTSPGALPVQAHTDTRWYRFHPVGGSPDLSTVYFNTFATLTPEDEDSGRSAMQSLGVYKWENGRLSNAGVLPDGSLSSGGSIAADRVGDDINRPPNPLDVDVERDNAVSRDGRSLIFVSPDPTRAAVDPLLAKPQLYMAADGKDSVLISAPEGVGTPLASTAGVEPASNRMIRPNPNLITSAYAVATPDHSVVLFSTKDALTEDAEGVDPEVIKTYRYEAAGGSLTYLPDLDRTITTVETSNNAKYGQIVELSDSGDSMLYLTAGGSLRLWRSDKATLTLSEGVSRNLKLDASYITSARFSDDESVLALNSTGPLRSNPDHTPGSPPNTFRSQVYRYTVADDNLECISCKPGGTPTGAALSMWGPENGYSNGSATPTGHWSTRSMTADGSTIYFTTATSLLEADHNTVEDVYQWHDGQLALITTGASGAEPAALYETTPDGGDVFIVSSERLVPADTDDFYDIYDVRVNGGFDPPEAAKGGCAPAECQGPPPPAPAPPAMGSAEFAGLGNRSAAAGARRRAQPLGVSAAKSVTGSTAVLRVRVPAAGRIVLSGRYLQRAVRGVAKVGIYRLRAALTPAGRRQLGKKASLQVGVRVSFRPRAGSATSRKLRVTFKQPGAKTSPSASRKGR